MTKFTFPFKKSDHGRKIASLQAVHKLLLERPIILLNDLDCKELNRRLARL